MIVEPHGSRGAWRSGSASTFVHLPVTADTKPDAGSGDARVCSSEHGVDPRGARPLHADPLRRVRGELAQRASSTSTIRSSPRSCGGRPYHQAHERGVKIVGRHRALRDRGARRRADHRPGRRARQPSRLRRRPAAPRAATSRSSCSPAPCGPTSNTACWSTAAAPSCSTDRPRSGVDRCGRRRRSREHVELALVALAEARTRWRTRRRGPPW